MRVKWWQHNSGEYSCRVFLPRRTTIHAGLGSISAAHLRYLGRQESHIADIRSPKLILFTNSITRNVLVFLHTIYQYAFVHLGIPQRVNHIFSTDMLFFWWSRPAWMQSRLFSTTCEFEAVMSLPFSRAFGRRATKMTLLPPLSLRSLPKMNSASTSSGSFSGTRQVMKTYALLLQKKTSQ